MMGRHISNAGSDEVRESLRWHAVLTFVVAVILGGCDDTTGVTTPAGVETAIVLNSVEISVTVFPVDTPDAAATIGLGPAGSPVSLAARGPLAVAPLGTLNQLAVVDLRDGDVQTVALPTNSGATGAAFVSDSIVLVGNPNLNTVSVVDARNGQLIGAPIPVGTFPQAVIADGDRAFVLNAELDATFVPARAGRVYVIDATTLAVIDSFALSGLNPTQGAFGPDGLLYILNAGAFGQANGSLSVVDPAALTEIEHHNGFGEFPGSLAIDESGMAYVAAFDFGLAIWDTGSDSFVRSPADPLVVQGVANSGGVGIDSSGRIYTLVPDCVNPSVALRLNPDRSFDREIDVGICPFGIAFTTITD